MSEVKDRIFVSIGVSKPNGGLAELPGAITAAERMAKWASAHDYETVLVHDELFPEITVDILRKEISSAIEKVTNKLTLERLVIYFAGHGAALAVGDQYWVLTKWDTRSTEAIKVSSLQRMLEYYGPKQVAIIGDACQEFSARFIDLVGSPVLDKPGELQHPYELDQFFAVDVGQQAFMIKAKDDQKDFCLFTEVLLDALEGDGEDTSYEEIDGLPVVTSQSLARYLEKNVALEATKYGVRMVARPRPGFYTDRAYQSLVSMLSTPEFPDILNTSLESVANSENPESSIQPSTYKRHTYPGWGTLKKIEIAPILPSWRSVSKANLKTEPAAKASLPSVNEIDDAREVRRMTLLADFGNDITSNQLDKERVISVNGADVANIETSFGHVKTISQPNCFGIALEPGRDNSFSFSDTLITLQDGRIIPVCSIHDFSAVVHVYDTNTLSLFHRPLGANAREDREAVELLARAQAGLLDLRTMTDAALMLRYGTRTNITIGCIAAQFYDAIRDVDSLRSMAWFYAKAAQPVPIDIALYGCCDISESDGRLYAYIPAVLAREPRTSGPREQPFTCKATQEIEKHPIAGRIPWMRQAWSAVETAAYDITADKWRKDALAAMSYLAPGKFTTIKGEGYQALRQLALIR